VSERVSVIIPVYNGERYLAAAIQSVLEQTLPPDEIIVVDDGSTDGTAAIVTGLAGASPLPIHYIHQQNQGPSAARNRGLRAARSGLVAFLDADDIWDLRKQEIQVAYLAANPDALMSGDWCRCLSCTGRIESNCTKPGMDLIWVARSSAAKYLTGWASSTRGCV
jgi:glycosyltransferase involved in cell wall biosynthesis